MLNLINLIVMKVLKYLFIHHQLLILMDIDIQLMINYYEEIQIIIIIILIMVLYILFYDDIHLQNILYLLYLLLLHPLILILILYYYEVFFILLYFLMFMMNHYLINVKIYFSLVQHLIIPILNLLLFILYLLPFSYLI